MGTHAGAETDPANAHPGGQPAFPVPQSSDAGTGYLTQREICPQSLAALEYVPGAASTPKKLMRPPVVASAGIWKRHSPALKPPLTTMRKGTVAAVSSRAYVPPHTSARRFGPRSVPETGDDVAVG